jgi:hypothetical protein
MKQKNNTIVEVRFLLPNGELHKAVMVCSCCGKEFSNDEVIYLSIATAEFFCEKCFIRKCLPERLKDENLAQEFIDAVITLARKYKNNYKTGRNKKITGTQVPERRLIK